MELRRNRIVCATDAVASGAPTFDPSCTAPLQRLGRRWRSRRCSDSPDFNHPHFAPTTVSSPRYRAAPPLLSLGTGFASNSHTETWSCKSISDVRTTPMDPLEFGSTAALWNSTTSYRSIAVGMATISSCLFGYSLAGLNSCNSTIILHFEWCGSAWNSDCPRAKLLSAAINAILYVGAIVGALAAGPLVSKGRKFALQVANCIFLLASLMGAASFGVFAWVQLLTARAIVGLAVGIVTVAAPLYISEVVDPAHRGFYGTLHQICISIGIFLAVAFGLPLKPNARNSPNYYMRSFDHLWWRVILGFPLALAAASAFGFCRWIVRETPQFLVAEGRTFEAMEKLMLLQQTTDARDVEPALLELAQAVAEARNVPSLSLMTVLGDPFYRYGVLLGAFLAVVQQATGINVITSSSTALLTSAGFKGAAAAAASTAICIAGILAPMFTGFLADRTGRRSLLLNGLLIQAATTAPVGALRWWYRVHSSSATSELLHWATLAAMAAFTAIFSAALGPVLWIYLTEIYPAEIRAPALATCAMLNWISGAATVFVGHFLDATSSLLAFGIASFFGFLGAATWVIETQGCSLNDSPVSPREKRLKSAVAGNGSGTLPQVTREDVWYQIRLQSPVAPRATESEDLERGHEETYMPDGHEPASSQWHLLTDSIGSDDETGSGNTDGDQCDNKISPRHLRYN